MKENETTLNAIKLEMVALSDGSIIFTIFANGKLAEAGKTDTVASVKTYLYKVCERINF